MYFSIENDVFCIENDEFCDKIDRFYVVDGAAVSKTDELYIDFVLKRKDCVLKTRNCVLK